MEHPTKSETIWSRNFVIWSRRPGSGAPNALRAMMFPGVVANWDTHGTWVPRTKNASYLDLSLSLQLFSIRMDISVFVSHFRTERLGDIYIYTYIYIHIYIYTHKSVCTYTYNYVYIYNIHVINICTILLYSLKVAYKIMSNEQQPGPPRFEVVEAWRADRPWRYSNNTQDNY